MTAWVGKKIYLKIQLYIDDSLIWMVNRQRRITNNFCWKLHILHGQNIEQYNLESSCIDLNNFVEVGNITENIKK